MKTKNGFTLLENEKDVKEWLSKQKVTRKITRLQVHMMDLPNYSTWEKTDKKVFSEPHFGRTQSLDSYGKSKWGCSDGHGHYIAQHLNIFPDGKITTGRNLNSTPIGIRGWNTNAICIEIYGCFDKGKDKMTAAQKKAVIYLYGELCKRFDIPVNTTHIRPHCWFTAGGTYLGKYNPSRSAKTCPGTAFWGYGCSPDGFAHFIKVEQFCQAFVSIVYFDKGGFDLMLGSEVLINQYNAGLCLVDIRCIFRVRQERNSSGHSLFNFSECVYRSVFVSNDFPLDKCCNLLSRELHVFILN